MFDLLSVLLNPSYLQPYAAPLHTALHAKTRKIKITDLRRGKANGFGKPGNDTK